MSLEIGSKEKITALLNQFSLEARSIWPMSQFATSYLVECILKELENLEEKKKEE